MWLSENAIITQKVQAAFVFDDVDVGCAMRTVFKLNQTFKPFECDWCAGRTLRLCDFLLCAVTLDKIYPKVAGCF